MTVPADKCGCRDADGICRCDCPLCWLAGHRGPVPADWPTYENPARVPPPEPEPAPQPTLFDEATQ